MNHLTKNEQLVLSVILGLLILGWTVKAYRQAHPPPGSPALAATEGN